MAGVISLTHFIQNCVRGAIFPNRLDVKADTIQPPAAIFLVPIDVSGSPETTFPCFKVSREEFHKPAVKPAGLSRHPRAPCVQ